ncbi:MAG: acyl-CoA dehydrogenase family protein [Candidatus Sigynarchaeota archaeon]
MEIRSSLATTGKLGSLWKLLFSPERPGVAAISPGISFGLWWKTRSRDVQERDLFEGAVAGGFDAPCLAFAFGTGYQMALRRLVPGLPLDLVACIAATEQGGAHPRAIQSTIRSIDASSGGGNLILTGRKKWITLAAEAWFFIIAASAGTAVDGRNQIRMVKVPRDATGLLVMPMKNVPFLPEISHGEVILESVRIKSDAILPGDGYADYLRPFRTVEDIFVGASLLGFIFRAARERGWSRAILELLACQIAGLHAIASDDLTAPETHVALGGFLAQQRLVLEQVDKLWQAADPASRDAWNRDKLVLEIAGKARAARLDSAWKRLGLV